MSPRRKTEPSTRVSSRSARTGRSGLIAREKTEKQYICYQRISFARDLAAAFNSDSSK